jgi:hypothetical protein
MLETLSILSLSSRVELSRVETYVTTDGQSASLSCNKAPIWGLWPHFYYCQTIAGLLIWGALSDGKTGLSFTIAAGLRQLNQSRVWVPRDSRPYFTVPDSRLPFSSPPTTRRATVEVFHPASIRDLFRPLLPLILSAWDPRYIASGRTHRQHRLSTVVPLLGVVAETCLPRSCLAMDVSSDFTIPDFGRRVTILKVLSSGITWCSHFRVNWCFLLGLFFDPEEGDDVYILYIDWFSTGHTTLYPRR